MISSANAAAFGINTDQQATVAKDFGKTYSTASTTSALDGGSKNNNRSTLISSGGSSARAASASVLTTEAEDEHGANSAGNSVALQKSVASMVSFSSSSDEGPDSGRPNDALGNKVDVVYSLLSMLSSHDRLQSSQMLLSISQDRENCQLIRGSGCLGLLIQLLHPGDAVSSPPPIGDELEVIRRASEALKNIIRHDDDSARQRRDSFVILLLEHVRNYVLHLRMVVATGAPYKSEFWEQAYAAMGTLTKLSYDEEQRRSICVLGGLQCIAEALILDQRVFNENCLPMHLDFRRFIGMTLTNLTYGTSETKRMLCSSGQFLQASNAQVNSQPEELRQVFAGVFRNLSWKTDASSKTALREAGIVATLTRAAMEVQKEATLKSVLSALWNLSAHCSENKAKICAVPSALEFLVSTLVPSRSLAIVESGGGILRNVSSHVSLKEEYRAILRRHNCFQILLEHLQSPSLTVVSNACATLWNLSAHNAIDQRTLLEMGAEKKLRGLVHSKYKMISLGSSATLKNLLSGRSKEKDTNSNGERTPSGLMKLRQLKSTMEHGDHGQTTFMAQQRSNGCDQTMDMVNVSPHRRQTPTMEIAAMLSDITRPVVLKSATPPFRLPTALPAPPEFNENVFTPLMFSRQSSLESLDSCEQHSIKSTVNSEYSQLPTGLPSPSELPDSPMNTLPKSISETRFQISQQQQQQQQPDQGPPAQQPQQQVDDICQELQECILAGRPCPKPSRTKPQAKIKPMIPITNVQAAASSDDTSPGQEEKVLQDIMRSAMPKPRNAKSKRIHY